MMKSYLLSFSTAIQNFIIVASFAIKVVDVLYFPSKLGLCIEVTLSRFSEEK